MSKGIFFSAALLLLAGCSKSSGAAGAAGAGGGAGAAGSAAGSSECAAADASMTGSALHAAAADVLTPVVHCGFSSCHISPGQAKLHLLGITDLHAALVGKPSCEAPSIPLIDGSGGDAALKNSWLWQKLTAAAAANDGSLTAQTSWPPPVQCGQPSGYGARMPQSNTADMLDAANWAKIRDWICGGAPGP
jgi:hypothetical protein